jgi:HlyD family secretion protein
MTNTKPRTVTGANMDVIVPKRRGRRLAWALLGVAATAGAALLAWQFVPQGLSVKAVDLRTAAVQRDWFLDEIIVRATAAPLESVILDSVESGRVEDVLVRDGALVKRGDLLFRLSNPQRQLELLARKSDLATQISNLSNLQVGFQQWRSDHRRRITELEYALLLAQKNVSRNTALADQGFVSRAGLEELSDKVQQGRRELSDETASSTDEAATRERAMAEMKNAIAGLKAGLVLAEASVDALAVRAPVAGRLTDFNLQIGETVRPDRRIGRIDDPERYKLVAQIDEFYLNRVAAGIKASVAVNGNPFATTVARVFPQIKEGRFVAELTFNGEQPKEMRPGQSADAQLSLGERRQALVLPNAAYLNDSGGAWVYVLDKKGLATRRPIRLGRRSNTQVEVLQGLQPGETVIISGYAMYGTAESLQVH